MSDFLLDISLTVNGEHVSERVEARKSLADFLREDLALTGTHTGCEHGVCGTCTVRVNGEMVRGCLTLAVQCDGAMVETIEGLSDAGEIADLQAAFARRNALQCGYCTPGMLIAAQDLLARGGIPSRDAIRDHLSGNYCRCTGYQAIVDAVEAIADIAVEVNANAQIAHYTQGYKTFDGLAFPTRRRVYRRNPDGTPDRSLTAITLDIGDITIA